MSKKTFALTLCSVLAITNLLITPADAKKWTVTQRQEKLSSEVDAAYKANQLTLQEADGLKQDSMKISQKEEKMKVKNGGKLSYPDENQLEKDLNKLSLKLHKKVLEKRVQ
jgi:hypothetical protein